ncbi:hypothetical protein [Bradyrhizobium sp. SZCCHNRI1073]|uniref:hypothetical protein n=1 Tax=Bradyrhizobium sp. SZCCHNRI1073 TaxID=3057280 RepID=UPI002916455C|nr:hypothetical protein [Bradyrhizobium sp. SZCCHNRI1073]
MTFAINIAKEGSRTDWLGFTGSVIGALVALIAAVIAWTAIQNQISADERRAKADRVEVDNLLQGEMERIAEALAAIWRVLEVIDRQENDDELGKLDKQQALLGITYGIEQLTRSSSVNTGLLMASVLGWERRRLYEPIYKGLEQLRDLAAATQPDIWELLTAVKSVSLDVRLVRPETSDYFTGLFERAGKAWSLGEAVLYQAGMEPGSGDRAASWVPRKQLDDPGLRTT